MPKANSGLAMHRWYTTWATRDYLTSSHKCLEPPTKVDLFGSGAYLIITLTKNGDMPSYARMGISLQIISALKKMEDGCLSARSKNSQSSLRVLSVSPVHELH